VLEQLSEGTSKTEFVKLDIDSNPIVASRYDVLSIPTVILFAEGEPRETLVGARPRAQYERAFADYL
jgi:thioredoxin 1